MENIIQDVAEHCVCAWFRCGSMLQSAEQYLDELGLDFRTAEYKQLRDAALKLAGNRISELRL